MRFYNDELPRLDLENFKAIEKNYAAAILMYNFVSLIISSTVILK